MKKIIYILVLFAIIVIQSFSGELPMNNLENTMNDVTRKAVRETENNIPSLELIGIGGSIKDNIIKHKDLIFNHKGKLNVDSSVLLIVRIVDIYLKNIHSEKRMLNYLVNHPFTYKNLRITIIIQGEEGEEVYHPDLAFINLVEGEIIYESVKKCQNEIYKVETINEEPYEDAVKRLGTWKNQPEETSENS
ncbi:MAG: hypothetical protein Tsb0021_16340 [Chlamydiales bacterium]